MRHASTTVIHEETMTVRLFTVALLLAGPLAFAATPPAPAPAGADGVGPKAQAPVPCQNEVFKFNETISFIQQTQGNAAAQDLKERLLPSKVESSLLLKDGYCGVAKYLRDKKLIN